MFAQFSYAAPWRKILQCDCASFWQLVAVFDGDGIKIASKLIDVDFSQFLIYGFIHRLLFFNTELTAATFRVCVSLFENDGSNIASEVFYLTHFFERFLLKRDGVDFCSMLKVGFFLQIFIQFSSSRVLSNSSVSIILTGAGVPVYAIFFIALINRCRLVNFQKLFFDSLAIANIG